MVKVNLDELVGKHIFNGTVDFEVVKKYGNNIIVKELSYNEDTDSYDETGNTFELTKSELERACKGDLYNGQNVSIEM